MDHPGKSDIETSYDRLAAEYSARIAGELVHKPFDRAMLDCFAELARPENVLDLGCGPGHVAAFLAERGIDITGIDLSAEMVERARQLFPNIPFEQGSMLDLAPWHDLAGIIAFYSIIHVPREQQPEMFSRWRESLRAGGHVLVAFHIGEADRHLDEIWGVPVNLDFLFFTREEVEERLVGSGFEIVESHERDPYPDVEAETRRAYILARRVAE